MEKHDGWIAKDKYGDFWYGTFGKEKEDVESHFKDLGSSAKSTYGIKIVKVRFVEEK